MTTSYFVGATNAADLAFRTNNTEQMRIQSGGNVGIGTASPGAKLDINGKGRISNGAGYLEMAVDGGGTASLYPSGGQVTVINGTGTTKALINVNGDSYFIGGNVGIGIATPGAKLDIAGSTNISQLIVRAATGQTNANPLLQLRDSAGTVLSSFHSDGITNTFLGLSTGSQNTGLYNTFMGSSAGAANTSGAGNVAIGYLAGSAGSGAGLNSNVFIGKEAGKNTTNEKNVFIGTNAGISNTSGQANTYIGCQAGQIASSSNYNTVVGVSAGSGLGSGNSLFGAEAGYYLGTGSTQNVLMGMNAGRAMTSGARNIIIGCQAGDNITTGSNNIIIGYDIDAPVATGGNQMSIGNIIYATGVSGTGTTVSPGKVGIGTASPAAGLDVQPVTAATGDYTSLKCGLMYNGGATMTNRYGAYIAGATGTGAGLITNQYALVTEAAAGNVGIGTATPAEKLVVAGGITLGTTSGTSLGTIRYTGGNGFEGYMVGSTGFTGWYALNGAYSNDSSTGWTRNSDGPPNTLYCSNTDDNVAIGSTVAGVTGMTNKFKVQGRTTTSAENAILIVDGDTTPVPLFLVRNDGRVGIGGNGGTITPEFRLTIDKGSASPDGGILAIGTTGAGSVMGTTGAGTRMIWYPRKAAFRAGTVVGTQWDDANIGNYSTAFGYSTKASGESSFAAGYSSTASGANSFAAGYAAQGTANTAVGIGFYAQAQASYSVALGGDSCNVTSTGLRSYAMGTSMIVSGANSFGLNLSNTVAATLAQSNTMAIMGGNVGIGTVTPVAKLEIAGSADTPQLIIKANTTQSNTNPLLQLRNSAGTVLSAFHSDGITNTFLGLNTGNANTGADNTFIGANAGLLNNAAGNNNTAVGSNALRSTTSGGSNTVMGMSAGRSLTWGASNTLMGANAGYSIGTGSNNVGIGTGVFGFAAGGSYNVAIGRGAMAANTANYGVAIGDSALAANTTGASNTAVGYRAGVVTTGGANIMLGYQAGDNITTGERNIIIGYDIDAIVASGSNQMSIGNLIFATGVDGTGTTLSTGSIGIGTVSPSHKLTISDSNTTADRAGLYVAQSGAITGTGYGGYFTKTGSSTTNVGLYVSANDATNNYGLIVDSGNVGIGTASPVAKLDVAGNIQLKTAGNKLLIKESLGTDAAMGTATLNAGESVTVSNTVVTANSRIFVTIQDHSSGTPGAVYISARIAATSFTITSTSGTGTSTVAWMIVEPAP
ncbi:MAG: hypothetical protein V1899_06325 [Planctomycetota bacterium]